MSDFQRGLAMTAIPLVGLAILGWWFVGSGEGGVLSWSLFGIVFLAALVIGIVLAVRNRRGISAGIFVGLAIGVVAAGVSCFAIVVGNI